MGKFCSCAKSLYPITEFVGTTETLINLLSLNSSKKRCELVVRIYPVK